MYDAIGPSLRTVSGADNVMAVFADNQSAHLW
jgi:hypothetical protein